MDTKGFFSNWIVRNLLGAAVAILALVVASAVLLNVVTHHGQEIGVPDFSNMSIRDARKLASDSGVRIEVTDSVYVRKMGRGLVFSQNPKAGSRVKQGRRIMLTINSVRPKKVSMPDLVGFSMRQAKAELLSRGLMLGDLRYVDDMATNNVLRQLYRGQNIAPGRMIDSGSEIDLVVGLDENDNQTFIPDVSGMKYMRAVDAVHENSLNVARLRFDKGISTFSDSLDAVVYKQTPAPSADPVRMGSEITLFLHIEPKSRQ
jgi:eukaryotic-like serine/threonine-protein kinase